MRQRAKTPWLSLLLGLLGVVTVGISLTVLATVRSSDIDRASMTSNEVSDARAAIARAIIEIERLRSDVDHLTQFDFTVHDYNAFCEDAVQRNPKFVCDIIPARPLLREGPRSREQAPDPSTLPLS